MRLFNKTFFGFLFSFGILLALSFLLLFATNYFIMKQEGELETTCITSSGEPC
jgi:hypothetical protein